MTSNVKAINEAAQGETATKPIRVQKHTVYPEMWDDLAGVTLERILRLKAQLPGGCIYLNPAFTVEAPEFSLEFSEKARNAQGAWLRTMSGVVGNKGRKNSAKDLDFTPRQLIQNGLLLINRNRVAPHDWTAMENELKTTKPLHSELTNIINGDHHE